MLNKGGVSNLTRPEEIGCKIGQSSENGKKRRLWEFVLKKYKKNAY